MIRKILGIPDRAEFLAGLTFQDLKEITMNFSVKREFAQGPYGRFYWGLTKDGKRVSVMLLGAGMARIDSDQLRQELDNLRMLNHPNLVRLIGYCCGTSSALCLEDLPNGSLHRHLSDASNGLDWRTRYRIIKGTCEASKYIHVGLKKPILHVLLEPSNIFLDENMEPKLVLLGLFQEMCAAYDRKYLAPEHGDLRADPKKGYIFSLGVVMMEIMTGPMGYIGISDMARPQFIDQVQENWRKRMQHTCSGSEVEFRCQQVKSCIMIALSCVDSDEHKRPSIMEIINKLNETECNIGKTVLNGQDHQIPKLKELPSLSSADKSSSTIYVVDAALETQQEQPDCGYRIPSMKLKDFPKFPIVQASDILDQAARLVLYSSRGQEKREEASMLKLYDGNHVGQEMNNVNMRLNSLFAPEESNTESSFKLIKSPTPKALETFKQKLESFALLRQAKGEEASKVKLYDGNHGAQETNNVNMRLNSKSNSIWTPKESDGSLLLPGSQSSLNESLHILKSLHVMMKPSKSANPLSEVDSSVIPQRDSSDLPQVETGRSAGRRKAPKLNRAANKEQHAEPCPSVPSPQSLASYIRMSNRRNEHSSSKKKSSLVRMDGIYISQLKALERTVDGREPPSNLSLAVLQLITNNFSDELIIGRGGCGVVYKVEQGILTNGIIAVKKLFNSHTFDDKMFYQEVNSMMMVNHQNTVRFLGYCSHTEEKAMKHEGTMIMAQIRERLLCFEYMGNRSLNSYLTDELRGLEWRMRYQIIQGICEGLQHLHKEKRIIHMDLKPANILLDDNMVPEITDFGLSRLDDKSQTMGAQRLLSLGYCAPEYLHHGKRSAKSDIYSLGVIILELVTGSKQIPCTTKVLRRWKHRWNRLTKDTQLGYKQVAKCLNLAQRCIQMDPADRPNIWDIINDLNKMDNCNVYVRDGTECQELEDMLGIEPLEIHLAWELNKQVSCSVVLTNNTDDYFAFRISTTSLLPYCINTNKDIVQPRSKCSVTITLQEWENAPPRNQRMDEFSVQSTRVDGSLTATDITGDLFAEYSGKAVDDVNLVVVLDVPPPLPGDG